MKLDTGNNYRVPQKSLVETVQEFFLERPVRK